MAAAVQTASMRPPEFTGGNVSVTGVPAQPESSYASMRPPEFTGGNAVEKSRAVQRGTMLKGASMRPPEFTGGN